MPPQNVDVAEEWVLGVDNTPFYTKRWFPTDAEPKAYIVFVHGFAEHIQRYDAYFHELAAQGLHVFGWDQRGFGRTGNTPLASSAPEVEAWKKDGKKPHILGVHKGKHGGFSKAFPDIEHWIKRENERAAGKPLFLYGHSMGGGEVLGFATRRTAPPAKETLQLLSGVIASGPFIRSTNPLPYLQVKAARLAIMLGLGGFNLNTGLKVEDLTHDAEIVERTSKDPWCEPVGSLSSINEMILLGESLDSKASWEAWPKDLPLFLYHGGADAICCPKAAVRFGDNVVAKDKTVKVLDGLFHEPHNENAPEPGKLAEVVGKWVIQHSEK